MALQVSLRFATAAAALLLCLSCTVITAALSFASGDAAEAHVTASGGRGLDRCFAVGEANVRLLGGQLIEERLLRVRESVAAYIAPAVTALTVAHNLLAEQTAATSVDTGFLNTTVRGLMENIIVAVGPKGMQTFGVLIPHPVMRVPNKFLVTTWIEPGLVARTIAHCRRLIVTEMFGLGDGVTFGYAGVPRHLGGVGGSAGHIIPLPGGECNINLVSSATQEEDEMKDPTCIRTTGRCPLVTAKPGDVVETVTQAVYKMERGGLNWAPISPLGGQLAITPYITWTASDGQGQGRDGRVGVLMANIEVGAVSNFLRGLGLPVDQSRVYSVQRHPWRTQPIIIGASFGEVSIEVAASDKQYKAGSSEASNIKEFHDNVREYLPLPLANVSDPLIREHGADALRRDFANVGDDAYEWTSSAGVVYWERFGELLDNGGARFGSIALIIERRYVMRDIHRANAATRAVIAEEREEGESENRARRDRMVGIVAAICAALMAASVLLSRFLVAPLRALRWRMNAVAHMDLEAADGGVLSYLVEVRDMQCSFLKMVADLRELRSFLPQSVLISEDEHLAGGDADDADVSECSLPALLRPASTTSLVQKRNGAGQESVAPLVAATALISMNRTLPIGRDFSGADSNPLQSLCVQSVCTASPHVLQSQCVVRSLCAASPPNGRILSVHSAKTSAPGSPAGSPQGNPHSLRSPRTIESPIAAIRAFTRRPPSTPSSKQQSSPGAGNREGSPRRGSRPGSHPAGTPSGSRAGRAPAKRADGAAGFRRRQVSVVVVNSHGFLASVRAKDPGDAAEYIGWLVAAVVSEVRRRRGITDGFTADHSSASFNAALGNCNHRAGATGAAAGVCASAPPRRLGAWLQGAATPHNASVAGGAALCGVMGCDGLKKYSVLGGAAAWAGVLERVGRQLGAAVLVDHLTRADTAADHYFLALPWQLLWAKRGSSAPTSAWVHQGGAAAGDRDGDEWMYQMAKNAAADPCAPHNEAAARLFAHDPAACLARLPAPRDADHPLTDVLRRVAAAAAAEAAEAADCVKVPALAVQSDAPLSVPALHVTSYRRGSAGKRGAGAAETQQELVEAGRRDEAAAAAIRQADLDKQRAQLDSKKQERAAKKALV